MTPQFAGINVPRVNLSHPEAQKQAISSDFGSDLQKIRTFSHLECSLEVAINFENLQFTFTALDAPGCPLRDTG